MMESNYTQIETKYKGVRGWLLLFCLGLTAFGPLITIGNLFNSYEELNPYFDLFPGLLNLWIIDSILSICLIIFAIYTGFMLFSIRPGAVKTAKIYLFVALGYSTIASLLLPFIAGLPSEVTQNILQEGIGKFIGACITFAIWYSYLLKSKRVKATYGTVEKERKADKQLKQSEPEVVQLERKEIESEDTLQMEQVVKKQDIEPHRIEQSDIANEQEVDNELKYRNYPGDYPPDWEWRKREVKERDKYTCQASKEKVGIPECGKTLREDKLHVHHIIPFKEFGYIRGVNNNDEQANALQNLLCLCRPCHVRADAGKLAVQAIML